MTQSTSTTRNNRHDRLRFVRRVFKTPGLYFRPWFFAYFLLGIVTAGMIPILLPMMIAAHSHRLVTVAIVMGAFDLGLLASPLWGIAAERYNLYRPLFFSGFAITALGTVLMPLLNGVSDWFVTAFLTGVGTSGRSSTPTGQSALGMYLSANNHSAD